jgi:hypothetical protein
VHYIVLSLKFIAEPKSSLIVYRRLRLPEPEKENRMDRRAKRLADGRKREMQSVGLK